MINVGVFSVVYAFINIMSEELRKMEVYTFLVVHSFLQTKLMPHLKKEREYGQEMTGTWKCPYP